MLTAELPGSDGGKRYTFTRTNEHSGQRFQMTLLERDDTSASWNWLSERAIGIQTSSSVVVFMFSMSGND